jgi:hypothetical protein
MKYKDTHGQEVGARADYVLDNAAEQARVRFAALPRLYDAGTIRHLEAWRPGWMAMPRSGGGGETIATWLSDRVGTTGHVLVTDLNTRFLERSAGSPISSGPAAIPTPASCGCRRRTPRADAPERPGYAPKQKAVGNRLSEGLPRN